MKKPGRTILFLSIWTSWEPESVWELWFLPNPQVNLSGNSWVIHYNVTETNKICLLSTVPICLQCETTGTMESGIFCSSKIKVSGSLGLRKINNIPLHAMCTPKPWAKHGKGHSQKNTNKGKENLKREIILLVFYVWQRQGQHLGQIFLSQSMYSWCISDFCLQLGKKKDTDSSQTLNKQWGRQAKCIQQLYY